MTPAAATKAVAGERRNASSGPLRRAAASLDQPGRTVAAALLRTWLLFGVWVSGAALLGAERSTLEGIGTIAMAVGLSQLAGSVLIRRWERRHGERVVVVEGELQRVALSR